MKLFLCFCFFVPLSNVNNDFRAIENFYVTGFCSIMMLFLPRSFHGSSFMASFKRAQPVRQLADRTLVHSVRFVTFSINTQNTLN